MATSLNTDAWGGAWAEFWAGSWGGEATVAGQEPLLTHGQPAARKRRIRRLLRPVANPAVSLVEQEDEELTLSLLGMM